MNRKKGPSQLKITAEHSHKFTGFTMSLSENMVLLSRGRKLVKPSICFQLGLYSYSVLILTSKIIDGCTLCLHSGISADVSSIDELRTLQRNQELPHEGPLCDLVFSEPVEELDDGFLPSPRGAGFQFGRKVLEKFLKKNGLKTLIRSSKCLEPDKPFLKFWDDQVITIFSAPNYCYR
jgi:diadenosine tetraphosphatase ApaH/serine/threonine PP2A family protein phosphatase